MRWTKLSVLVLGVFFLYGCGTTLRTSAQFEQTRQETKTIAVLPPDVKVYEISAGGVSQEMDEWNAAAKQYITAALKENFTEKHQLNVKFIDESWLRQNHRELWRDYKSLYYAVSYSALMHAFPGANGFPDKIKSFDYTLGGGIADLARVCEADSLLFVWGMDTQITGGRMWVEIFNAALLGVYTIHPSVLTLGLVSGKTGNLDWFITSPAATEYNFRDEKNLSGLVGWLADQYVTQTKK